MQGGWRLAVGGLMRAHHPRLEPSAFDGSFRRVLHRAAELEASDIHFEPLEDRLRIRVRVHGRLLTLQEVDDPARVARLMEVVKKGCGFNLGLRGEPQDARFSRSDLPYDYRAALVPIMEGESIVLRLLARDREFDLDAYPLRMDAKADLRVALQKRDGLIIVSGPTGSGKSTLLYNALGSLDRERLKIGTIEDPVEYRLDGVCQSQVDRAKGASFAGLLRAFMRADPDVILVGEIRDEETAEAALHAAATGHLVLSTVHANSAEDIAVRLEGLGVERAKYEANLRFASAQRLAPKLCPSCAVPDEKGSALVKAVFNEDLIPMRSDGCEACGNTGVSGRVLLFEWQALERTATGRELRLKDTLEAEAVRLLREGQIDAATACGY